MNLHLIPSQVQIPIDNPGEKTSADGVPDEGGDHGFPDIVTDSEGFGCSQEDGERDEIHVGNYVVGSKTYETHYGEPD